jgi:hypothetical protein
MIRVIGAATEIVPLRDLNDRVFYKQEKTYSEAEYDKSNDLKREIKRGRLRVLSRMDEKFSGYEAPSLVAKNDTPNKSESSSDVQALIEHIGRLETKINGQEPKISSSAENALLIKLTEKIESLEDRLSQATQADNTELLEAVKRLETRVSKNESTGVLEKLEEILSRSPQSIVSKPEQKKTEKHIEEEIYVPKIRVEDGSSHINLKTRAVEKSGGINAAAEALKKLRGNK